MMEIEVKKIKGYFDGELGFISISTLAGYLMPNPLYTYKSNI